MAMHHAAPAPDMDNLHGHDSPHHPLRPPSPAPGYAAPPWLPGERMTTGLCKGAAHYLLRERWTTPDGDFIDLDWLH